MNEQNNNNLGGIIQPSVVPEVKDSNTNINPVNNQMFQNNINNGVDSNIINSNNSQSTPLSFDFSNNSNEVSNNVNTGNNVSFTSASTDTNIGMMNNSVNNMNIQNQTNTNLNNSTQNNEISGQNIGINNNLDNQIQSNANQTNTINNSNDTSNNNENIVSVKKYLINMILFMIPIVGFIMLLVRIFDKKDKNISNFAKAKLIADLIKGLILIGVGIALSIFIKQILVEYLEENWLNLIEQSDMYENFTDNMEDIYDNAYGDIDQDYSYDIG